MADGGGGFAPRACAAVRLVSVRLQWGFARWCARLAAQLGQGEQWLRGKNLDSVSGEPLCRKNRVYQIFMVQAHQKSSLFSKPQVPGTCMVALFRGPYLQAFLPCSFVSSISL